jgi:hypothetical protein
MSSVLKDVENLLEESLAIIATPEVETMQLLEWGRRREMIFSRLRATDIQLSGEEQAQARSLAQEILTVDSRILAAINAKLALLGHEMNAANKMRRMVGGALHSPSASLMERVA